MEYEENAYSWRDILITMALAMFAAMLLLRQRSTSSASVTATSASSSPYAQAGEEPTETTPSVNVATNNSEQEQRPMSSQEEIAIIAKKRGIALGILEDCDGIVFTDKVLRQCKEEADIINTGAPDYPSQNENNQSVSTNMKSLKELEEYCSPSNGSLSLEGLREKLMQQPAASLSRSHFLHELCLHPNVTLKMVEMVLRLNPYTAYFCTNRYRSNRRAHYTIEDYDGKEISEGGHRPWSGEDPDRSYPIHVACANSNCPGDVVRLLVKGNPSALKHFCLLEGGCHPNPECDFEDGLPIHYYLGRPSTSHVDVGTVKCLVEAYPGCLGEMYQQGPDSYHPIHVLAENETIAQNIDILRYLVNRNPGVLKMETSDEILPIHKALLNKHVTTEIVEFLIEAWPDSTFIMDNRQHLPIHKFCTEQREGESKEQELDILRILIAAYPESVRILDRHDGSCLLHHAVRYQSRDFVKILVDAYPESLQQRDTDLKLAFHYACVRGSAELVKYMYEMDPESINVRDYIMDLGLFTLQPRGGRMRMTPH